MVDYTNEIASLKKLWEQQLNSFKDICRSKAEALKTIKEIETKEILAEIAMSALQIAIDELKKLQKQS